MANCGHQRIGAKIKFGLEGTSKIGSVDACPIYSAGPGQSLLMWDEKVKNGPKNMEYNLEVGTLHDSNSSWHAILLDALR